MKEQIFIAIFFGLMFFWVFYENWAGASGWGMAFICEIEIIMLRTGKIKIYH